MVGLWVEGGGVAGRVAWVGVAVNVWSPIQMYVHQRCKARNAESALLAVQPWGAEVGTVWA